MIKSFFEKSARIFRADSANPRMLQEESEQERRLTDLCVLSAGEALAALDSGLRGLSSEEAEKRLDEYGPNELSHTRRMGFLADIFQRCRSPLVVQLLIIALISGAIGEIKSAFIVSAMVFLSVGLSYILDRRSSNTVEMLGRRVQSRTLALRDCEEK